MKERERVCVETLFASSRPRRVCLGRHCTLARGMLGKNGACEAFNFLRDFDTRVASEMFSIFFAPRDTSVMDHSFSKSPRYTCTKCMHICF